MRRLLFLVALVIIAAAALVVPMPWLVVAPGEAVAVPQHIEVREAEGEITGDLLLTTVELRQTTAVGTLLAFVDDDREVVARQRVIPPDVDEDRFVEAQRRLFQESARVAVAVGARAAGVDVQVSGDGARVAQVIPDGPADGELEQGDVIVAVGGESVEVASDVVAATSQAEAGDRVSLTVERGGERREVEVELERVPQIERPAIGVAVATVDLRIEHPFDVDVDAGRVGGPSAGLMIALAAYDMLGEEDLTRGRVVAGTGTMDLRGRVGAVGGVTQKVEGARAAGADLFLVWPEEADEARSAAGDLPVVEVESLEEAVAALAEGPTDRGRRRDTARSRVDSVCPEPDIAPRGCPARTVLPDRTDGARAAAPSPAPWPPDLPPDPEGSGGSTRVAGR